MATVWMEYMNNPSDPVRVMAIDCCEHILAKIKSALSPTRVTEIDSRGKQFFHKAEEELDLIVISVTRYPVRRLFISQLRRIFINVPVLVLRREDICEKTGRECIHGEFIVSDKTHTRDLETVRDLRLVMPFAICEHTEKGYNFDIVREVIRIITERHTDPDLDLSRVAKAMTLSPAHLSKILNKEVGVSFRQLLRQTRIAEAKRLLATKRFSVKEVAQRVGFADSHYFSRSFKVMTGTSASDYQSEVSVCS